LPWGSFYKFCNPLFHKKIPIIVFTSHSFYQIQNQMTKTRLEAFSDGVIAILITIMVLELKIPHEATMDALIRLIPVLVSYLLSFIYIGIYWGNHHHLMHMVKQVTPGIIWANMSLLFFLSLIPFSTGWMGENHFEGLTVAVYAINLLLCAVGFYILQSAIMPHLEHSPNMKNALKKQEKKGYLSLALYSICVPCAFFLPIVSCLIIVITAILWVIPDKNIERALKMDQ
jgi:uncharacterized membrane protein